MVKKSTAEHQKLQRILMNYVEDVVEHHFEKFAESRFSDEEDDFQTQLLLLLRSAPQEVNDEVGRCSSSHVFHC